MDELQISGRRYISSRRVAKEHGYHSDYIGQLIRGNKIKGTKVGRAWYVDAESLDAYLGKEGNAATSIASEPVALPVEEQIEPDEAAVEKPLAQKGTEEKEVVEDADEIRVVVQQESEPEEKPVKREESAKTFTTKKIDEPAEPSPIPVRLEGPQAKAPIAGLKYYRDTEPLLPEIQSKKSVSRISDASSDMIEEEVAIVEASVKPAKSGASMFLRHWALLTSIGVVALIAGAAVSNAVYQKISIEANNSATVSYGFDFTYPASFVGSVK